MSLWVGTEKRGTGSFYRSARIPFPFSVALLPALNQWAHLSTVTDTGSVATVTLTDTSSTNGNRFYRLARPPSP
jgi:hypothetical protein